VDADSLLELLPDDPNLHLTHVQFGPDGVTVDVEVVSPSAACPRCGRGSEQVHSWYTRRVADLPCCGRTLAIVITARKFRCSNPACPRAIFCERLPDVAPAHARTTRPLTESHRAIGFAAGGEAGARLAERLAMPTSPDTLLRRVKAAPEEVAPPPRCVGVDDWAWKKGHRYGTILIDLERGRVLDILPGRDGEALKVWLRDHPGVEVITRDRWPAFAQAAAEAAPQAMQVADRWHLLKNLREAVERLFERRSGTVKEAVNAAPAAEQPSEESPTGRAAPSDRSAAAAATPLSPRQQARNAKRQRRVERYERARQLHADGHSIRQIAAILGISREAAERYVRRDQCPDWRGGRPRPTALDEFREEVDRQIRAGCPNAATIHRVLNGQGCRASYYAVRRFVRRRRAALGVPSARSHAGQTTPPRPPSARLLSYEFLRRPENRDSDAQAHVEALLGCDGLGDALDLAGQFVDMVRKRLSQPLADWLAKAEHSTCAEVRSFAKGIRQDEAAVTAALTESWSNGPVEGHVNRLKFIKRAGFGRAGFQLLRARVRWAA